MRGDGLSGCCRLGRVSFSANPGPITPTEPIIWNLALLTQPIALASVHFRFGVSVGWVILANTLTYGLIGLVAETMRQKLRHAD